MDNSNLQLTGVTITFRVGNGQKISRKYQKYQNLQEMHSRHENMGVVRIGDDNAIHEHFSLFLLNRHRDFNSLV